MQITYIENFHFIFGQDGSGLRKPGFHGDATSCDNLYAHFPKLFNLKNK